MFKKPEPIRDIIKIYVGCAANHEDLESQAVLEWSLRKNTKRNLEITWMSLQDESKYPYSPFSGWDTSTWATPFSGFRWIVPYLAGYQGKAIYFDSDFIVLDDIGKLWDQTFSLGKFIMAKGQGHWRVCCSLWNCEMGKKLIPSLGSLKTNPNSHRDLITKLCRNGTYIQPFRGDWNNLDGKDGKAFKDIQALHYTAMESQPQLKHALPRLKSEGKSHWYDAATKPHPRKDVQELFDTLLEEAIKNGYPPDKYKSIEPLGRPYNKRSFSRKRA